MNIQKYKTRFIEEINKEVDEIFPQNKNKERDNALLLVTVMIVKFEKILESIKEEIK